MAMDLRSAPIMTLSLASSKSAWVTMRRFLRAAISAASLTRLARSAPEKPGVPRAMVLTLTSAASGTLRMCTRRIFSRPLMSGLGTTTWRSKRPGRSRAGSSTSGRLVAATRMMPSLASKPSISTSSWFSVCSRSSLPPPRPAPRWRPTASISSMKMMQGAFFLACSNMSRTRLAPTPTNISTKSEPEMVKKGTPASPAMARASRVLPVPGGPISRAPLGILPPRRWNLPGSLRKSTISLSSSLASSTPATSSKVTLFLFSVSRRALERPKPMAPRAPPCMWRMTKIQAPISSRMGSRFSRMVHSVIWPVGLTSMFTPFASIRLTRSSWLVGVMTVNSLPFFGCTWTRVPRKVALLIWPASVCLSSWL